MTHPNQSSGRPIGSQEIREKLIVIETDDVVAKFRNSRYKSLSDLAFNDTSTFFYGTLAALNPGLLWMKSARDSVSTIIDAYSASDSSVARVTYAEAKRLQMPPGHPVLRGVYAAHPLIVGRYYAIASFHSRVFEDKVAEAKRLLMSLGATSIGIKHVRGWGKNFSVKATAQATGVDVGAEAGSTSTSSSNLMYEATFDNDDPPSLPENLHWYAHEPLWQQIAEGRLKHGMRSFSLAITYDEDHNVNVGLKVKLEKEGLDLGGAFREHVATTWNMTGTFNDKKPA